jgi:hypothetical protein
MHNLEKKVLELIGEDPDSPDVFVDTAAGIEPIRDSLNDAIQEIVTITGSNKQRYLIPLRAGQQFYRLLPTAGYLGWITDVWLVNKKRRLEQTGLMKVSRHDPRWMVSSSDPISYVPIGNNLVGLYPKPSASSDAIEVTVVEIPKEYDNERAKIKIKADFQYAAVEYAVSEYWASRGDADEATVHYGLYMKALGLSDDFNISPYARKTFDTTKESAPTETA